jgi:hypothetical protein
VGGLIAVLFYFALKFMKRDDVDLLCADLYYFFLIVGDYI